MSRVEVEARLRYPDGGFTIDVGFTSDAVVTALLGPSGSGKSSVLALIAGLRRPDAGRIRFGDRVFFDREKRIDLAPERRQIGYVVQDHLLFPHLTVRRNLEYGLRRRSRHARHISLDRVVTVLELDRVLGAMPASLSGGEKQRAALGRALLCSPDVLLLDEPLAALDDRLRSKLLDTLEEILAEWAIPTIYVTHQAEEAARLAGRLVRLHDGRVVDCGPNDMPDKTAVLVPDEQKR